MLEIAFLANQRNCKETFLLQPPPINDHQDMPPVNDGHKRFHSHYVKSVRIRSFSGPYFPALRLNTEIYFVNLCIQSDLRIQSECGKLRKRKSANTFHAVSARLINPFHATGPFLFPLKILENHRSPDVFHEAG